MRDSAVRIALCAALLAACSVAHADPEDPFTIAVGATVQHDDNLFRLAPSVDPQTALGKPTKADDVAINYVRLKYDKTFSQQRITLGATSSQYRYKTFSHLNFDASDYDAKWQWNLTRSLSGHVIATRQQTSTGYTDFRNFRVPSIRTTEYRRFDLDWWAIGAWHLVGGVVDSRAVNGQVQVAEVSYRYRPAEVGVMYQNAAGNSLTLVRRQGHGENPGQVLDNVLLIDTGFEQSEEEARLVWQVTGKSRLNGRVTHFDRRHDNFSQRNFRDNAGRLDYQWLATGKLQLTLSALRDIGAYTDWSLGPLSSTYYVNRGLSLAPKYQLGAKTALRITVERNRRDYKGAIVPLPSSRWDRVQNAQVGLDWAPMRSLSISAVMQYSRRTSNYQGLEFRDKTASLTAQFTF